MTMSTSRSSEQLSLPATINPLSPPRNLPAPSPNQQQIGSRHDREIAVSVCNRLSESAYYLLRALTCEYHEGVLCLRGSVPSFYLKQMAQAIACQVEGVEECVNRIEVGTAAPR